MIDRIRAGANRPIDPELRQYKANIGRVVILAIYISLTIWLILDLLILTPSGAITLTGLLFQLIGIAFLAITAGFASRWIHRGRITSAGYLLASAIFLIALVWLWLFPDQLLLISAIMLVPIIISGSIVGGRSPFLFATLAALVTILAWVSIHPTGSSEGFAGSADSNLTFLVTQIAIQFAIAAALYTLSRNNEATISRLRSQTDEMTHLALTDPLTGLANRRHMIEQLGREFQRARRYRRPLSLVYIDLDGFKAINDRFGHMFGDEVLKNTALAMQAVLRSTDLLARIGGDEFAVLLPETNMDGAKGVVSKLWKALEAFNINPPASLSLSFCAGIARLREDDESVDDLLARADEAMYGAKAAGRSQVRTQEDVSQLPLFEAEKSKQKVIEDS